MQSNSDKPIAIFCCGVSGSGKSTWARQQDGKFVIVSRDDFRVSFVEEQGKEFTWSSWNWKNEDEITRRIDEYVEHLIVQGASIIFADTNLNKQRLNNAMAKMEASGFHVSVKSFLDLSLDTCIKQDLNRRHSVGRDVIHKQWEQAIKNFPELMPFKQYRPSKALPMAVLVDLDGTVAEKGDRSPFDWDKVDQDMPIKIVIDIVNGLYASGYEVIFMSGRDNVCRTKTRNWLAQYVGEWTRKANLYMRKQGDQRRDSIAKAEMFWDNVVGKFNVVAALDDRKQVLELWTNMGIKTIDVGNLYQRF